eukprot:11381567-Alexandrium_andersonii.AAC.1
MPSVVCDPKGKSGGKQKGKGNGKKGKSHSRVQQFRQQGRPAKGKGGDRVAGSHATHDSSL